MKHDDVHAYDDIRNLAHPYSKKHPQMSMIDRAAQFAPFAALTGHKEAIKETQRIIEDRRVLDEYQKEIINDTLQQIQSHIKERPLLKVTYFQSDMTKDGGSYLQFIKNIKRIDEVFHYLIFVDQSKLAIADIYDVTMVSKDEDIL